VLASDEVSLNRWNILSFGFKLRAMAVTRRFQSSVRQQAEFNLLELNQFHVL
jgi:hypothetical protein